MLWNLFVLIVYMRTRTSEGFQPKKKYSEAAGLCVWSSKISTIHPSLLVRLLLSGAVAKPNFGVDLRHIQVAEAREDVHLTSASADTPNKEPIHACMVGVSEQKTHKTKDLQNEATHPSRFGIENSAFQSRFMSTFMSLSL